MIILFSIKSGRTPNIRYPRNLQADIVGVKAKKLYKARIYALGLLIKKINLPFL